MKKLPLVLVAALATTVIIRSQDVDVENSGDLTVAPVPAAARILGDIPDGTPPPPAPQKPEYQIAARDVLSTAIHEQGGRTITIRQIKPIDLPPPPAPVEAIPSEVDPEFAQRLAEYRETHPKSDLLFLSATVYRSKDSPPCTLVRYWPEGNGGAVTFWSSADFALIAGGINSFMDSTGGSHHLMMAWSRVDIERMAEVRASRGLEYNAPEIPDLPEGKASFQVVGAHPDAEKLAPVQALHDIYNSELARLRTAYAGRERARIEREEYLKANPPQPKDITLNFWRTEKPAANGKGESK